MPLSPLSTRVFQAAPILVLLFLATVTRTSAQSLTETLYTLDVSAPSPPVRADHLKMGGTNGKGQTVAVNNRYISLNGKPSIPITGEFHFSRYPRAYWADAIQKMKAGGINMVATYVFWSMHEEHEGQFTWQGDRDLRHFIELCAQYDMPAIVRIGPFGHGEIRNGALPDWLLGNPLTVRSNDPAYLAYVERLYNQIGEQLRGLMFRDGGPVVAIQLENEYQSSAAPWGLTYPGQPLDYTAADRDRSVTQEGVGVATGKNPYAELGNDHLRILKSLAQKAGLVTPIYTATGWGNAAVIANETLPVTAGYAYPTWTKKKDISPFYLYTDLHKKPDYAPVRYVPEDYPYFCAELGSGIMSTYSRRPVVPANSMDALINRCLGSGANGIGYYMYHGGSTPKGDFFFNDEAYGYPKISYDFQAPIGEYGQVRPAFHRLKLLHYFLNSFSPELAPMTTRLPQDAGTLTPTNVTDLRYAVRTDGKSGFLFLNNFQDDTTLTDKTGLHFQLKTATGTVSIPEKSTFALKNEVNAIFPYNLDMNGVNLIYATAQLLTRFTAGNTTHYVFFAPEGIRPEFSIANRNRVSLKADKTTSVEQNRDRWLVRCPEQCMSQFAIRQPNGTQVMVLVVDFQTALTAWETNIAGQPHLVFSPATVLPDGKNYTLLSTGQANFTLSVYPNIAAIPKLNGGTITRQTSSGPVSTYRIRLPEQTLNLQSQPVGESRMVLPVPATLPPGVNDIFATINYVGDTGMGFLDGQLVTDEFYKGLPWQIGLKRFVDQKAARSMTFYFRPLLKNAPFLVDIPANLIPEFDKNGRKTSISSVDFTVEYKAGIEF